MAVHDLDVDVGRVELPERHERLQGQGRADLRGVGEPARLDVVDAHRAPGAAYAGLPAREGAGTDVTLKATARHRRRGIELVDVVAHHPGGEHLRSERLEG